MIQTGKEYRGDVPKPMSHSKAAVSQISEQIMRLRSSRDRIEHIRDRLIGRSPKVQPESGWPVAEVTQDTLLNDLHGLHSGLLDTIGEIEVLLGEIEDFV